MKFELSKKFNIKGLIGVSAVALAMIGAGGAINANNNAVHADDATEAAENMEAKNEAYNTKHNIQILRNHPSEREELEQNGMGEDIDDFYQAVPQIFKHGYNKGSKVDQNSDKVTLANHFGYKKAGKLLHTYIPKTLTNDHSASTKSHATTTHRHVRHHLTMKSLHEIEDAVSRDEKAIHNDQKHLNTRSGRAFERNMSYYKDLQSRKASLRRVVRSHHASKSAKRHARKLLRSLNKKAPRQKKMAKGLIAYYMRTSKNLNASKANLKKISKAKRTPKNVKKYINNFLKSLNKKASKKAYKVTKNHKKSAKRVRA